MLVLQVNIYPAAGWRIIGEFNIGHYSITTPNIAVLMDVEPWSESAERPEKMR